MSRSVRFAVLGYAGYASLLILEVLWEVVGPKWFGSARAWSAMHPAPMIMRQLLGATAAFLLAWALGHRYRWAWFVSFTWASILSLLGFVLLGVAVLVPGSSARGFVSSHRVEAIGGVLTIICLGSSAVNLCKKDARDYFSRRQV